MQFRFFALSLHFLAMLALLIWYIDDPIVPLEQMAVGISCLCLASVAVVAWYLQRLATESLPVFRNPIFLPVGSLWCYTFGYMLPWGLGWAERDGMLFYGTERSCAAGLVLAGIGFLAWTSGILWAYRTPASRVPRFVPSASAAWLLTSVHAVSLVGFFAINGLASLSEAYSGSQSIGSTASSPYIHMLLESFYYMAALVTLANIWTTKSWRFQYVAPGVVLFLTSVMLFWVGRRTPLALCFTFCFFLSYYLKPFSIVKRRTLRVGLVSVAVLFAVVFLASLSERFRTTDKSLAAFQESVVETWANWMKSNYVVSAGYQIGILNRVVAVVPSEYPYGFGLNMPIEVINTIPFSSNIPGKSYLPPMTLDFVHQATFPQSALFRWGLGGHLFADCYHQFGVVGVGLLPFLYSLIFCKIHARAKNTIMLTFIACLCLGSAVSGFRNSFLTEALHLTVWCSVPIFFVARMTGMRNLTSSRSDRVE